MAGRTGEPVTELLGVDRPDGTRVWLRVSAVPVPVEGQPRPMVMSTFVDVTEAIDGAARLAESEERFRLMLEHAPIGMAIVDLEGVYLAVNPRLAEMLGRRPEALVGRSFSEFTHPDDVDTDVALSIALVEGRIDSFELDKRYIAADGSIVWGHLAVAIVRTEDGEPLYGVSQVKDITEARRTQELLEERVLHDPLTGLANRVLTADRIHQLLSHGAGTSSGLALLCCGIDGLKRVNDSLGHAAGDALIASVGERIASIVGTTDCIGRGDGDEFYVLVEDAVLPGSPIVPVDLIEQILAVVTAPVEVLGRSLRPAVSIGVAVAQPGESGEQLVHDATTALYAAKGRGRGEWVLFEPTIRDRAVERLTIESELSPAIGRGEFELHYQPIVELSTRRVAAYEALARWRHPIHGLLMPAGFIPVAQDTGIITELGAHLIDEACAFLGAHPGPQVFVNVSPSQLGGAHFADVVAAALERHAVDPARLGIELTESSVLHASGSSHRALHELADLGVDLVLDDFGTGYSAVAALLATPIRGLKLDRSFTSRLGLDPQADLVTRALGSMVEALGFRGVAEGVETESQRAAVLAHGWRFGQGWLFGRPVPADELDLTEVPWR